MEVHRMHKEVGKNKVAWATVNLALNNFYVLSFAA